MITSIIDTFREQTRQHKAIKAFYYNRNYELGTGKEAHPLFWLEDPISGRNQNHAFVNSVNFSILFTPDKDKAIAQLQNLAFSIGLNIIERIKKQENGMSIVPDWNFMTLRDYYDNNSCGCRFSVNITQGNMQDRCLIEEQFDTELQFEENDVLKKFELEPANNCDVFVNKFPQFNLKLTK